MGVDMGEPRGAHVPVLLERCLELLGPALARPGAVHVDFTLGLGGHAEAVLERHPDVVLIGLDRDTEALAHSRHRLAAYRARTHLVHAVYDELPQVLADLGYDRIHSGLFDLGVSSLQLDEADRGFAYAQDAPLDMRMDQTAGITAEQVVNEYEPGELCLESKSLKIYLSRFRDEGVFCEALAVQIRDEVATALELEQGAVHVTLRQKARGGITITASV